MFPFVNIADLTIYPVVRTGQLKLPCLAVELIVAGAAQRFGVVYVLAGERKVLNAQKKSPPPGNLTSGSE
jgi:hypothetical protein